MGREPGQHGLQGRRLVQVVVAALLGRHEGMRAVHRPRRTRLVPLKMIEDLTKVELAWEAAADRSRRA